MTPSALSDRELVDEVERVYDLTGLWTRPPLPLSARNRKYLEDRLRLYQQLQPGRS